jgi:hypothetical protein
MRQPLRRRVLGHRKSQQLPPLMAKNETYEESPKGNRRDDKQINRCNLPPMIAKETLPSLQWPALPILSSDSADVSPVTNGSLAAN